MIGYLRRVRMTRFERAYILLYTDRISAKDFARAAGIPDAKQAWAQLCEYRQKILNGELPDPRDVYSYWR